MVVLISVSLAFSQTLVYIARPQIQEPGYCTGWCCHRK